MQQYLEYWWNGNLQDHYSLFGYSIFQINKVFKISQYLIGLLAIFELIEFAKVMGGAKEVARWIMIIRGIMYLPSKILWVAIEMFYSLIGFLKFRRIRTEKNAKEHLLSFFHTKKGLEKGRIIQEANQNIVVQIFHWLENNPISENVLKRTTFSALIFVSLGELMTS